MIVDLTKNREADFIEEDESHKDLDMHISYSYPHNDNYEVIAFLERINMDKEKESDLQQDKGFIISASKSTKKEIKNPNGIFSTKFGQRLGDSNPYQDRYSCVCGKLRGSMNRDIKCPDCDTVCRYVDDDFSIFGWLEIDKDYAVIHPTLYKQIDQFLGKSKHVKDKKTKQGSVLKNIIDYDPEVNQDGKIIGYKDKKGEPYYGIGMIEFRERFDEIMEYYKNKNHKNEIYDDIMKDRDIVFTNSVPVFTTLLRPMDVVGESMYYEKTNGFYTIMARQASYINKNKRSMDKNFVIKNQQLFRFQSKYMELYDEIINILSGKKGELRTLVSGRFNFSSRCVIKQDPNLRIDQVRLPYVELVKTQEQRIINILCRTYGITIQEAYNRWYKSIGKIDPVIVNIINDIIKSTPEGIPVIINRNPTLSYGSILQMYCVGINFNYCMSIPLQVLIPLAADFDGDVLNVMHIINDVFLERTREVFNPRNSMYISRNDGMLNNSILPQKDTLVNANTLNDLSLKKYTKEELNHIRAIKEKMA